MHTGESVIEKELLKAEPILARKVDAFDSNLDRPISLSIGLAWRSQLSKLSRILLCWNMSKLGKHSASSPSEGEPALDEAKSSPKYDPDFDVDLELELDETDRKLSNPLRTAVDERYPLSAEPIPVRQFEVFDGRPGVTTRKWKSERESEA